MSIALFQKYRYEITFVRVANIPKLKGTIQFGGANGEVIDLRPGEEGATGLLR